MIDDLDLAWEEQNEPGHRRGAPPSRQARRRRRRERRRRRRSFGAMFISLLLLGGLGFGTWWGVGRLQELLGAPDYTSVGTTKVDVVIEPGDSAFAMGEELFAKNVVKSVKAFVNAARAEPRSKNIQPGTYRLFERMPARQALSMLLDPDENMVVNKVTIPEGRTAIQTYTLLSEATGIPVDEFRAAGKDPVGLGVPDYWFKRDDGKTAATTVEGFLFPDTYRLDPGLSATEILRVMVNRFLAVAEEIKFADTVQAGLGGVTLYEALIVASLAQAEAGREADMGKIARVAYNRLYKDFPCHCLQFDVTLNYWLELNGKPTKPSREMTQAELYDPKNPYNTHDRPGLPPGPISNPGKVALTGAMSPPAGGWYYFVAVDTNGTTKFATTDAEFQKIKQEACANGVIICS